MATIIPNSFTSYDLTDKEAIDGIILTTTQLLSMRNKLANIAEEKLRLIYDDNNRMAFIQQEAYLKGQMDILTVLFDDSAAAVDEYTTPEY